jgi:hypothetical protein
VYKRYASLYFVCGVDPGDNELLVLEVIHHFVEVLDRWAGLRGWRGDACLVGRGGGGDLGGERTRPPPRPRAWRGRRSPAPRPAPTAHSPPRPRPERTQNPRYFGNVCELDLIFNFHKAYYILDEILIAGGGRAGFRR